MVDVVFKISKNKQYESICVLVSTIVGNRVLQKIFLVLLDLLKIELIEFLNCVSMEQKTWYEERYESTNYLLL